MVAVHLVNAVVNTDGVVPPVLTVTRVQDVILNSVNVGKFTK